MFEVTAFLLFVAISYKFCLGFVANYLRTLMQFQENHG